MYMPNAKNLRWGPNTTYIPLEMGMKYTPKKLNVYGQRKKFASPNARDTNMLVFFALGNAKVLSFALGDAKLPNANGFASQWNIGFKFLGRERYFIICIVYHYNYHSCECMCLNIVHRPETPYLSLK